MKKFSLLYLCVVLAALSAFLYTSCKKPFHATSPQPNNIRLYSYTAVTRLSTVLPAHVADTTSDNYTFSYDNNHRVSQIMYTSSNPDVIAAGHNSERITFYYGNDTVIKTTANLNGTQTFEVDTFITGTGNLINTLYTPNHITNFEYYGKLMSRQSETFYKGANSVSESRIYTSDNGDFLKYSFDGTLSATFTNTMTVTPYPMRAYWVSPDGTYTVHTGLTGYTDILNGYTSGLALNIFAKDTANDSSDVYLPGNTIWPSQTYGFYTDDANRMGDYLQLLSFTLWGNNLYQNAHLVKFIQNAGYTTNVSYSIDAYSKVTQVTAVIIDSLANTKTTTYNLQYETY